MRENDILGCCRVAPLFCVGLLGVKHVQELLVKHPRDFFTAGRVKCKLTNDQGEAVNPKVGKTKKELYDKMSKIWPQAQEKYDEILVK